MQALLKEKKMNKPQITPEDREAAEKYVALKQGNKIMLLQGYLDGLLHERARAENVLVEALKDIQACYDDFGAHDRIADKAIKKWRGENG